MSAHNPTSTERSAEEDSMEITSFVNREVYFDNGDLLGVVHDVKLDFKEGRVSHLVIESEDVNTDAFALDPSREGIQIPYEYVQAVGDIIVMYEASA